MSHSVYLGRGLSTFQRYSSEAQEDNKSWEIIPLVLSWLEEGLAAKNLVFHNYGKAHKKAGSAETVLQSVLTATCTVGKYGLRVQQNLQSQTAVLNHCIESSRPVEMLFPGSCPAYSHLHPSVDISYPGLCSVLLIYIYLAPLCGFSSAIFILCQNMWTVVSKWVLSICTNSEGRRQSRTQTSALWWSPLCQCGSLFPIFRSSGQRAGCFWAVFSCCFLTLSLFYNRELSILKKKSVTYLILCDFEGDIQIQQRCWWKENSTELEQSV